MSWFGKIFGSAADDRSSTKPNVAGSNALLDALATYPPYALPYAGWGKDLANDQADANQRYLTENLAARLGHISALLAGFGVDAAPLLDRAADPLPAAAQIDGWLTQALPASDALLQERPPNPPRNFFVESNRRGSAVFFSFVTDLGLLEAEAVRIRHPGFNWGVARGRGQKDRMEFNRPCLIKPKQPDWDMQIIDHELWMLECVYAKRNGMMAIHPFGYQLQTLLRGGFDPAPVAR
jgi:hypothetical protein